MRTNGRATAAACAGLAILLGVMWATRTAARPSPIRVGRQADGSVITSSNQRITPMGRQVQFPGRPTTVRVRPGGKTATALNAGGALLVVVDLASGRVIQQFLPRGHGSFDGLVYSPDGTNLFASQANGTILQVTVGADGRMSRPKTITLPQTNGNPYPGGLAISHDGKTLFAALNRLNALAVIDVATRRVTRMIAVGNAPHDVVVTGSRAYVSDQGGRRAVAGDITNDSAGTEIVADPKTGGAATGAVSVVDLTARRSVASIPVGIQPTGMYLSGHDLFVANSSSDTVSVIDTRRNRLATTIGVKPTPGVPLGSQPNAVAVDGTHLAITLGRNNAVALYEWVGAARPTKFLGLLPTGWYPSSVAVEPKTGRLIVANTKGIGSLGPTGADGGHRVQARIGSLSLMSVPSSAGALRMATQQVLDNDGLSGVPQRAGSRFGPGGDVPPVAIPIRIGDPSLIKHIFYVIKENRTYDQVLGDDRRGDGDPALCTFGAQVTPNEHELATRFPLLDNYYTSGELSADAHQWDLQANVPDYLEKAFGGFARSYPHKGGDALAYEKTGFLWGDALAHGKTFADMGEYAPSFDGPRNQFGTWMDWYHDYLKLTGQEAGQPHVPIGTFQTHADVPQLDQALVRDFPNFDVNIPDQYRAVIFSRHFQDWVNAHNLPDLVLIHLPADHTAGSSSNRPTPAAMIADNDLALGKIVDEISHSTYWASSAIFVTEDDAQAGTDHIDGHRTTGYVISPYSRSGLVDSHYWTQTNMVRTIEQILGLPPMNQMDLAAEPMRELFTDTPDLSPYTARPNLIALDTMNGAAAAGGATVPLPSPRPRSGPAHLAALRELWQQASNRMGFDRHDGTPDQVDANLLNHAIWYASTGYALPYPGEQNIMTPDQVPPDVGTATAAD